MSINKITQDIIKETWIEEKINKEIQDDKNKKNIVDITKWEETIKEYFPNLIKPAKLCLAIQAQNLINDIKNPFAMVLIDQASAGKTLTLDITCSYDEKIHSSDDFTVASFVSHSVNVSSEKLSKIDLLPKIKDKTLVIKEMNTIFNKNAENLKHELWILTRVLDWDWLMRDSWVHWSRWYKWEYCFMLLGASTPIKWVVWEIIWNIWARIFFYHINQKIMTPIELAKSVITWWWDGKKLCKEKSKSFLKWLYEKYPNWVEWERWLDWPIIIKIWVIATLLSRLRWTYKKDNWEFWEDFKSVEHPTRLVNLLYNFARWYALIHWRRQLSKDDLIITLEVALSSAPEKRSKIIKIFFKNQWICNTNDIMNSWIFKSKDSVIRYLDQFEDLWIIKKIDHPRSSTEPQKYILKDDLIDFFDKHKHTGINSSDASDNIQPVWKKDDKMQKYNNEINSFINNKDQYKETHYKNWESILDFRESELEK